MWSLTDVDKVPLTCLTVLGDTDWWPLVLESPGIDFSPGKASWKTDFLEKSPGKVLEKIIC